MSVGTFSSTQPTAGKLQLRTSLLTCFGSSKACIAFSRSYSAEYCGSSRVLPVFTWVYFGWRFACFTSQQVLSPFLSNEDYCSSCKIYLQTYFGSSIVLVILIVFGRSTLDALFSPSQLSLGMLFPAYQQKGIAHI